jgi:hypothetical protein
VQSAHDFSYRLHGTAVFGDDEVQAPFVLARIREQLVEIVAFAFALLAALPPGLCGESRQNPCHNDEELAQRRDPAAAAGAAKDAHLTSWQSRWRLGRICNGHGKASSKRHDQQPT